MFSRSSYEEHNRRESTDQTKSTEHTKSTNLAKCTNQAQSAAQVKSTEHTNLIEPVEYMQHAKSTKHAKYMKRVAAVVTGTFAAFALAVAPTMAMAAGASQSADANQTLREELIAKVKNSPALTKVSTNLAAKKGRVQAFVRVVMPSGLEVSNATVAQGAGEKQAQNDGNTSARRAQAQADRVFAQLQKIDSSAKRMFTTSYTLAGFAVSADSEALTKLAQSSADVLRISLLPVHSALESNDTAQGEPQLPANSNSDPLVRAVDAWTSTGETGEGVNIAVVDTGFDYTHASFGGSGSVQDYETALARQDVDPLEDGTLRQMLDPSKYKGGYDFAGTHYGENDVYEAEPDPNPIDGHGGHHGTHVAGSAAGFGVTADGQTFRGDYAALTEQQVRDMKVGPGSAPKAGVYALKVFGDNGGSTNVVLDALDWVAKHNLNANDADKIDIVSMSLGGSFGSPDDPENVAVNNLTASGVLSVVAAGNDGDISEIVGAPGTATSALTVAASQSGRTLQDAIAITGGPQGLVNTKVAGQYSQNYAELEDFSVTGVVARVLDPANLEGCEPYSQADADRVRGKIAYIEWDDVSVNCGSAARFNNAEAAGAIGIVVASQSNIPEAGIAGNATIPGFQLVKAAAQNQALQQAIDAGTLEVRLGSDLRMSLNADYSAESEDTVASFTSRGIHGSYDGTVKPDVAAPGVGIISASAGTGSEPEVMSGTSMATPLTSGIAALVIATHPNWQPTQVKAQIMNTAAHDVLTADRSHAYGPLRVGTGRVDAYAAVHNQVLVTSDDAVAVTGQFGVVQVPADGTSVTKTFTVSNSSDAAHTYRVAYDPRVEVPGVTYSVSVDTVTVSARGTANFDVTVSIPDQSALRRSMDPTQDPQVLGRDRDYVTDASGVVTLTPADDAAGNAAASNVATTANAATVAEDDNANSAYNLRVAVVAAPRPVSATDNAFSDTNTMTISGSGVQQGEGKQAYRGKATPLVLTMDDGVDGYTGEPSEAATRSLAAGDIRAIGYSSTAPQLADKSQGVVSFGITTDKSWSHLGNSLFVEVRAVMVTPSAQKIINISPTTREGHDQFDSVWATVEVTDLNTKETTAFEEPIDPDYIYDSNAVVYSMKLADLGVSSDDAFVFMDWQAMTESVYAENNAENPYVEDVAGDASDFEAGAFDAYDPDLWFGDTAQTSTSSFTDAADTVIPVHHSAAPAASDISVLTVHSLGAVPDRDDQRAVIDIDRVVPVDKARLQEAVAQGAKLDEKLYTADSWKAYQDALAAAQAVLDNPDATQAEVDAAYQVLVNTYEGLVLAKPAVNKDKLQAEVGAVADLKEQDYTADSWKEFAKALAAAQAVLDNPDATQDEVNDARVALAAARAVLKPAADDAGDTGNAGSQIGNDSESEGAGSKDTGNNNAGTSGDTKHVEVPQSKKKRTKGNSLASTGAQMSVVAVVLVLSVGTGLLLARTRSNAE